jgi:hypothetical protein
MEGPKAVEPALQQTSSRDASPKKRRRSILDLQIRRIDCLLSHKENVLPKMKFRFHRENFVPAVSLGGMEHPAIQSETGDGGGQRPSSLRCSRPARDASPKKVEGIQILDLQIRRIDCLLSHKENVLPKMKFCFHRENSLFQPFRWAAWSTLRSRSKRRWGGRGPSNPRCS